MSCSKRRFVVVVIFVLFLSTLSAQTESTDEITLESLRNLREQTLNDGGLTDELREQILAQYDSAILLLETERDNLAAAAGFERERSGIDQKLSNLQAEFERPEPPLQLNLPENPTVEQVEDALARERARLVANMAALRDQQRLLDDRTQTRSDISRRLGELDLKLDLLNRESRVQGDSLVHSELKQASSMNILTQRKELFSENLMLREKLALLAELSPLIPLNVDLNGRRVAFSEEMVALYEQKADELRVEQANESLGEIHELSRQVALLLPQLEGLAAESEELAETLWGHEGVVTLSDKTEKALIETRNHRTELDRIADLTLRKFEAYGHRGSLRRWWPQIPEGFPEAGSVAGTIKYLDRAIPEVEQKLITFEQDRTKSNELARRIMLQVQDELGDEATPEILHQVRSLLAVRQNLLDGLIQSVGRYSNLLVEYRAVSENFLIQLKEIESFLYSNVMWSRSVPKPIIPGFRDLIAALQWLINFEHFNELSKDGFNFQAIRIFALLLLILFLIFRQPLRRRLNKLTDLCADSEKDKLIVTLEALIITGFLAAPLPIAFYLTGSLINMIGKSAYWYASADAFFKIAVITAILESIRQVFADRGIAEVHFDWHISSNRQFNRRLLKTEAMALPLLYIALFFAFAGMRLDSPAELQMYNNSLGRLVFIVALLILGLSILTLLRPEKKTDPPELYTRVTWPRQLSGYAFPTVFLGVYPVITLTTLIPSIMAAFGYYLTGLLLAYQMQRSLLLAFIVLIGWGLIQRAQVIRQQQRPLEQDTGSDHETADKQIRHLSRFIIMTIFVIGLLYIWSDALPMIQIFKRIQLLPNIELLEPVDNLTTSPGLSTGENGTSSTPSNDSNGSVTQAAETSDVTGSVDNTIVTSLSPDQPALTLWTVLQAILLMILSLVLVRNLPGVIEVILKRRSSLDSGARFAISTLFRYSIAIIGTVMVFNLLGVSWSKIQWLAAALTFGLGFGLQEIVANFVSGLILLVERPIRVGDVVTVGTLMGKVSRLQIRATTITLWDRSEMIVPNKEFITTKLVNWTLSDSKRRIDIPLRIAYGSELEKVKQILLDAATAHPMVLEDPEPQALVISFGDDSINLELRFVVDFGNGIQSKDEVQMTVDREFKNNGIEFALPQVKVRFPEDEGTVVR